MERGVRLTMLGRGARGVNIEGKASGAAPSFS